ncbi:MAG: metallophosphoesterase [Bryobacterales bacterium]|nr:metallophosphoesterase [Bryobacterales bacterium]
MEYVDWRDYRTDLPICSIVHFSDPHFGARFVNDDESWWAKLIPRLPVANQLTGLFPHSYSHACALALAINQIVRHRAAHGIDVVVVHTGDLTATGSNAEFVTGNTFVHSYFKHGSQQAGLGMDHRSGQARLFDIPGNHDLWSRSSPRVSSHFAERYGGSYPRRLRLENAGGAVELHGFDTNRGTTWRHRLADGELPQSQLDALAALAAEPKAEVRIACLHHPIHVDRTDAPKLAGREILKLKNRTAVGRSLLRAGFDIVLAGHVHLGKHHPASAARPAQWIAGSACQMGANAQFWAFDVYADEAIYYSLALKENEIAFWPELTARGRWQF